MMETLDSGIGSRSPTPDSSHSQTNSSKVTKATTHTNHINNNSHNNTSSSNGNGTYSKSKGSSSDKSDASSTTTTTSNSNEGGGSGGSSNNQNSGSSSSNNHHGNNTSNNAKTYRDYNNRHSSGHGQYKKYASHQNQHYGYGGHNGHYQRYNNNTHRNYGNKHYHNSNYHHNNHHHHYQGQGYHHQYNHQQNHHQTHNNRDKNNSTNANTTTVNNNSNSSSESNSHHQNQQHQLHHNNNGHHRQYFHPHSGTGVHHHHRNVPPPPPQVFISSDTADALSWQRHGGGESNNTNWSSPNLESVDSSVQISLNLSALKQGFYSPSPQNASPAVSPSTTDSSDAYSLQEDANISGSNGVTTPRPNGGGSFTYPTGGAIDTGLNGNPFPYHHYHPGFYTYPGANNTHPMCVNARSLSHHHQLIAAGQNFQGLLMSTDPSFTMGKADSSSGSEKTLEWPDDATYYPIATTDREDYLNSSGFSERCTTPDFIYAPLNIPSGPITAGKKRYFSSSSEKKRQFLTPLVDLSAGYAHYSQLFYNGTTSASGKLSPAAQNPRFHHYSRKMTYAPHGFPREFFDDLDPEDYVRAFSRFGEVKERPPALKVPQCDSLSEGIWLKFVENQQTTATFRKKMELWRDVYRIVRNLTYNAHFKQDPRNFPTFGLQVVGSTMSGFGSNTSDVDMCLLVRGSEVDQRYEAVDKLQVLYGALSATQWIDNVELIYAKVPILKFRDPKKSLEVDLNCNNFVGIRNTHLLYCYSQADWRLKPLVLVVKLWAHFHGINDAKNMTISSYSLVLMVIHFLQCGVEEPVLPVLQHMYPDKFSNTTNILHVKINEVLPSWQSKNKESIGNLLIQFLEYYAHKFDYSENAVSVRTGGTIPIKTAAAYKSVKNDPHQWKYLCIEEPFDRTNTARSVYDRDTFDKIVGIFNVSYQRLLASRNLEEIFAPIPDTDARAMAVVLR